MAKKDITSLRSTLAMLKDQDEMLTVTQEVDPHLEMAGGWHVLPRRQEGRGPPARRPRVARDAQEGRRL